MVFSLITTLLSMQWSMTHIHLSEQHNHDGGLHHHSIEAHAHNPISHHSDLVELSHQTSDADVLELNHEYKLTGSTKQKKVPITILASAFHPPLVELSKAVLFEVIFTNSEHLDQTTVYLRGPPLLS